MISDRDQVNAHTWDIGDGGAVKKKSRIVSMNIKDGEVECSGLGKMVST